MKGLLSFLGDFFGRLAADAANTGAGDAMVLFLYYALPHLLEKVAGKDEICEELVLRGHDVLALTSPFKISLMNEYYRLSNAHHRVHIVGIDDSRHVVFVRYAM